MFSLYIGKRYIELFLNTGEGSFEQNTNNYQRDNSYEQVLKHEPNLPSYGYDMANSNMPTYVNRNNKNRNMHHSSSSAPYNNNNNKAYDKNRNPAYHMGNVNPNQQYFATTPRFA